MFFPKAALVFSFLALSNIAAASTPACLLSAVGSTLANPADLKDACVTNANKLEKKISDSCDESDLKDALNYFSETCAQAGHKVDVSVSSSSSSPTGTSSSDSSKSTGFTTATAASGTQSSSGSGSGSGSSSSSNSEATPSASGTPENNAGSSDRHVSAAAFAAVVFVGFAATL